MSIKTKPAQEPLRTTVTLDPDVLTRTKEFARSRGLSFRESLNELVRIGLVTDAQAPDPPVFKITPRRSRLMPGLSYDNIETLLEYGEGPFHR